MTQYELEAEVAKVTGEELREIRFRGFSMADPWEANFDPEPDDLPPQMVDWDQNDLERNIAVFEHPLNRLQPDPQYEQKQFSQT